MCQKWVEAVRSVEVCAVNDMTHLNTMWSAPQHLISHVSTIVFVREEISIYCFLEHGMALPNDDLTMTLKPDGVTEV